MAGKKSKPKPSDLGTGGARKAADAIVARKKKIDEAANSSYSSPGYSAKTSTTLDMSNAGAYKKYQLEQAKKQIKKKK